MNITTVRGTVIRTTDLSQTAREITFSLSQPMQFLPGAFVNIFTQTINGRVRRAYSISSHYDNPNEISISVRKKKDGGVISPIFWQADIIGKEFDIMGPLGMNTSEKITHDKVFLFAFGIGVSVIKALVHELLERSSVNQLTIATGNRDEDEILYHAFLKECASHNTCASIRHVLSEPKDINYPYTGYIQNHIADWDFNNADIYICGQQVACDALQQAIKKTDPHDCNFLIESFG